ncbi:MAG: MFS transporter [Chloroflexi bacterium]|nr:MFS transporter [Chloroflexota bacterium]
MFANHKRDAYGVYLILSGATALFFRLVFTVNMVYQVTTVDLNALQLVLVGTTLEITIFLFEIPTGIVADVYSRRLSIIIGMLLIGCGFVVEGLFPVFEAVLLAQVLWGLGYTFTSGATQAWIADEVGEDRAGDAFLAGSQAGRICGLVAIPLAVGLAALNIRLPIVLSGLLFWGLGLFLALAMPETGFTPTPPNERDSWRTMFQTFKAGWSLVRGSSVLLGFAVLSVFLGLYSEGLDRLWTAHVLEDYTLPNVEPVVFVGAIGAVSTLLSIGVTEVVRRRTDSTDQRALLRLLFALNAVMVASIFVFALAQPLSVAIVALWCFQTVRGTGWPLLQAWVTPHIESRVRATVFSMTGQIDAISQVAGGPFIGWIGTTASIRAAIVTSGIILSPVLAVFAYLLRQTQRALRPALE